MKNPVKLIQNSNGIISNGKETETGKYKMECDRFKDVLLHKLNNANVHPPRIKYQIEALS